MRRTDWSAEEEALWEQLRRHAGETFRTAKGLAFTYTIRGNELFVSRRSKSITRATVSIAVTRARALKQASGFVEGPKKLGVFGASYLYPLLVRVGEIIPPGEQLRMDFAGDDDEPAGPQSSSR